MLQLHSHRPPILHRDLKSPNLLVDKHWRCKIADFNLSRVMETTSVMSSITANNPRWLAPEVITRQEYSKAADIFSFGIILWELLVWRLPWEELGPFQVGANPAITSVCHLSMLAVSAGQERLTSASPEIWISYSGNQCHRGSCSIFNHIQCSYEVLLLCDTMHRCILTSYTADASGG